VASDGTAGDDSGMLRLPSVAVACLSGLLAAGSASLAAQAPPAAPGGMTPLTPDQQALAAENFQRLPWQVQLGIRVAAAEAMCPVMPQVTLVPDEATFLDEIGRWSLTARWPVLIEDERFSPLFVRAFRPERVVRRPSVGPRPADGELMRKMVATVSLAWNGAADRSPDEAFRAVGLASPGVVVTSAADPAWPAAVALAAGRGQPLVFLDGDFGGLDDTLDAGGFGGLRQAIERALDSCGFPYRQPGNPVGAITVARMMAPRTKFLQPPELRPGLPASAGFGPEDPLATLDLLFRRDDGSRYAIGGWIFGDSARAAYMAMCSLFLPRQELWFVSGYPRDGNWSAYEIRKPAERARELGYATRTWDAEAMSLANWRRFLLGGIEPDVLLMNSSGDPEWFSLYASDRARVADVPFLRKPLALSLIHSWSLKRPGDRDTVGGRWLERGVYSLYGSVHEPFLGAFVPPAVMVERIASFAPFLVAARMTEGEFGKPWRLVAIGDPLMLAIPPAARRIPVAPLPDDGATDLRRATIARLKAARERPDAAEFAAVMRDLVLLGEDDVAVGLWKVAEQAEFRASIAPLALGPLFRKREFDAFVSAFRLYRHRNPDDFDMLWHLATPRITSLDEMQLMLLVQSLRPGDPAGDLAILVPGLDRVLGPDGADRILDLEARKAKDPKVKSRIEALKSR